LADGFKAFSVVHFRRFAYSENLDPNLKSILGEDKKRENLKEEISRGIPAA